MNNEHTVSLIEGLVDSISTREQFENAVELLSFLSAYKIDLLPASLAPAIRRLRILHEERLAEYHKAHAGKSFVSAEAAKRHQDKFNENHKRVTRQKGMV